MTDTSKPSVEKTICNPIIRMVDTGRSPNLNECGDIIDTARALSAERDALRQQVADISAQPEMVAEVRADAIREGMELAAKALDPLVGRDVQERDAKDQGEAFDFAICEARDAIRKAMDDV